MCPTAANTVLTVLATLVVCVLTTSITRYQHYPLPMCSEDTVCSEISELPSIKDERNFFSWMMCRCPGESVCPKSPGKQTIEITGSKWYGMCRPSASIRPCSRGEVAEEYFVGSREIPFATYTRVHCTCPLLEYEEMEPEAGPSMWEGPQMDDDRAKTIYQLTCSSTGGFGAEKRGRGRGRSRGRFGGGSGRRFYFYRK